jgi:cytochrome c oxidase subunit II
MPNDTANVSKKINATEKRALVLAILFVTASLGMIAYATWGLGINVPSCVPQDRLFQHGSIAKHGGKNYEIRFLAKMWGFEPSRVRLPTGSTVDILLTSKDVTHGLQILGTNVNLMAVPGSVTPARIHFEKPGVYFIVCHEYCGAAHESMNGILEVSADASDISAEGLSSDDAGRKVLDEKGCLACHSIDGTPGVGPTFKGMWGQSTELVSGTSRKVDGAFVREMILHPGQNPIKGFDPVMPELPVNDEEIKMIEQYLEGLK